MMIIRHAASLIIVLFLLSPCFANNNLKHAKPPLVADTEAVREEIKKRVTGFKSNDALSVRSHQLFSNTVVPTLYELHDYSPVWVNEKSIDQFLLALETIDGDGLVSSDYHFSLLKSLRAEISTSKHAPPSLRADFDLLLSDSLVCLGYHLLVGKVDPVELDTHWNMDRTVGNLRQIIEKALNAIADGTVDNLIQSMRPQSEIYTRLRSALAHYRSIETKGGWGLVAKGPALKRGMADNRVVLLRKRLIATYDLEDENQEDSSFDKAVEDAVIRFQKRHALDPDGIVGQRTLEALNRPVGEKIGQILVNLERARWVLHDLPEQLVLVDIAGFQVQYLLDKKSVFEARAQVGTTYRKTPVFKDEIQYLELNPTWTVPQTIFLNDLLPKIKEDPAYLQKKGFRVITYQGGDVDKTTIDWSKYPKTGFPYLLRQDPGPENALGQIKFMFPNAHAVYLHDTPSRALFDATERAFSSGCVRIENPFTLAEMLLDDEKWTRQELLDVIDSGETKRISLKNPVTVLLLYWTVKVADDGTVIFKNDIYQRDRNVLNGLNAQFKFRERPIFY